MKIGTTEYLGLKIVKTKIQDGGTKRADKFYWLWTDSIQNWCMGVWEIGDYDILVKILEFKMAPTKCNEFCYYGPLYPKFSKGFPKITSMKYPFQEVVMNFLYGGLKTSSLHPYSIFLIKYKKLETGGRFASRKIKNKLPLKEGVFRSWIWWQRKHVLLIHIYSIFSLEIINWILSAKFSEKSQE